MAKGQGKGKGRGRVQIDSLTADQQRAMEAQLALQERALQMAEAQAEREQAEAGRAAQREGFQNLANLFAQQATRAAGQYDTAQQQK